MMGRCPPGGYSDSSEASCMGLIARVRVYGRAHYCIIPTLGITVWSGARRVGGMMYARPRVWMRA